MDKEYDEQFEHDWDAGRGGWTCANCGLFMPYDTEYLLGEIDACDRRLIVKAPQKKR